MKPIRRLCSALCWALYWICWPFAAACTVATAFLIDLVDGFERRARACAAGLLLACVLLPACTTLEGGLSDYSVIYTGDAVEVTNFAAPVVPGQEATTATGVGWNLKQKRARIVYADGHSSDFGKLTGGGFGGGRIILAFEGGMRITVNLKTRQVTVTGESLMGK